MYAQSVSTIFRGDLIFDNEMKGSHMLKWVLLLASIAGSAPFCVVTSYGNNCWYYGVSECQRAAAQSNGMCVANNQAPAPAASATYPVYTPQPNGYQLLGDALQQSARDLQTFEDSRQRNQAAESENALLQQQLEFQAQKHHVWMMANDSSYREAYIERQKIQEEIRADEERDRKKNQHLTNVVLGSISGAMFVLVGTLLITHSSK